MSSKAQSIQTSHPAGRSRKKAERGRGSRRSVRGGRSQSEAPAQGASADGTPVEKQDPAPRVPAPQVQPLLVLISAPSGGGKTTLCQHLLATYPHMTRAITCTTRAPRVGEVDGVDYYFLDADSFLKRVHAGNFLEHATVYGNSYGTLKSELLGKLRQGKDVLLNVDVQGAAAIRERALEDPELKRALVTVFLTPRSLAVLEERLRKRGTDAAAVIQKRLGVAKQEIAQWKNFEYLLVSETIQEDLRRMLAIVQAEKMRTARAVPPEI
ncbi:MAG TPA: guanylate kinase [Verrucomicrobiae bacterium]|nr:guanylate kinase [Verrucomicrobiae bacterium]